MTNNNVQVVAHGKPPSAGQERSKFDPYNRVVNLSKAHVEERPRLMLKGTELLVKGKAQAIRNTQQALKILATLKPKRILSPSLSAGASIGNLTDLELILPEDLVMRRRSIWPIVQLTYRSFHAPPTTPSNAGNQRNKSFPRSLSAPPAAHRMDTDQVMPAKKGSQSARSNNVVREKPTPRRPESAVPPQKSASYNPVHHPPTTVSPPESDTVAHISQKAQREHPGETAKRRLRSGSPPTKARPLTASTLERNSSPNRAKENIFKTVPNRSVPAQPAQDPQQYEEQEPKQHQPRRRQVLYESEPLTAYEKELKEKSWNDSWNSQRDREPLWDITNRSVTGVENSTKKVSHKTMLAAAISRANMGNDDSSDNIRPPAQSTGVYRQKNQQKQRWYPPSIDAEDVENFDVGNNGACNSKSMTKADRKVQESFRANQELLSKLPPVFPQQQVAIKNWVYSLGLSIHEGEGGFITTKSNTDSSSFHHLANLSTRQVSSNNGSGNNASVSGNPPPPPESAIVPLKEDRLRNGVFLCELINVLEPNASRHAQLLQLVRYKPINVNEAMENIQRALWLLRIRKSPPIPLVYLSNPKGILQANRSVLWGLLGEMMQVYHPQGAPGNNVNNISASATTTNSNALSLQPQIPIPGAGGGRLASLLPYTIEERRILDASLMHWLVEEDILGGILKSTHPSEMPSLLSIEKSLRDGTLFCLLVGKIVGSPVVGWTRKGSAGGAGGRAATRSSPLSTRVCVSNMEKCLRVLRSKPLMSTRFLYSGRVMI